MTAPTSPQATAQQAAYAQQQAQLRAQLIGALAMIYAGSVAANVFSPAAAARFVAQMLPVSLAAQRTMAAITQAQLQALTQPPRPIIIAPQAVTGAALRGVDPAAYYERPFKTIRYELSRGKTLGEAIDAGRRRAESIAATDLELAHTHTASRYLEELQRRQQELQTEFGRRIAERRAAQQQVTREPALNTDRRVVGYRRQLSSNPNHCALCLLASTQRYRIGTLMPIHPGCGCIVVPIFAGEPASHVVDPNLARQVHDVVRRDLGQSYVDAGGRLGDAHYRDIIITNEHGELGPVLGVRGQNFQGPEDLKLGHERVNPEAEAP